MCIIEFKLKKTMISHHHKCIFIHIPKAAGTSIETFFLDDLGLDFEDKHALILGKTTNLYLPPPSVSHLTASQMLSQFYISKELFSTYFKFTIVRNPLDRLYSSYKYLGYSNIISFDTFIIKELPRLLRLSNKSYFFKTQTSFLYDQDNNLLVDFIGKFENIEQDFSLIKNKLNMGDKPLTHVNKSSVSTYHYLRGIKKALINPRLLLNLNFEKKNKKCSVKALDIMEKIYKEDFINFNYKLN
jgi:hypothetical protein